MARGDMPAGHSTEIEMLLAFLGQYREIMIWKIEDLDEEKARFRPTENGNSLLNLIVHLTGVEWSWSEQVIAGNEVNRDRDAEFRELDEMGVAKAIEAYRAAGARTNEIARAMKPEDACKGEPGFSVRWVLTHLVEETARHAGHADITRELIDGKTGFSPADPG
jgi:uncharacterized damage-inducible protein DinB